MPLMTAKLVIHRHSWSSLGCASKACQAGNPQAFMISAPLGPHLEGLHKPALSPLSQAEPLRIAKPVIHKHSWSLPGHAPKACQASNPQALHDLYSARLTPFRQARPMLQRPARLPQWQVSACKPVGPHPPATHYSRAPNLPRRHR
jgi:hypothetical protein